ncbi:MAG TPA: hypothetical protein VE291_01725 [Terracidiphilus sp.]|jgi:hypothetical protein|nr:hypothetical protein [Terracidiphilus sp.]
MKKILAPGIALYAALLACAAAQEPVSPPPSHSSAPPQQAQADSSPVPLEWTPPALAHLSAEAAVKSNFTLDRNLLAAASALIPDSEAEDRQVIRKLDGVSVHTMRFGEAGIPDEREVESIRAAYHLRGWKHVVTSTGAGGPVHNGTTDVWVVLDGVNVRGAVVLSETPRSLTLVTIAGNLNPVDILHLRGHFGIPRFDAGGLGNQTRQ